MLVATLAIGAKVFWALINTIFYALLMAPLLALANVIREWSEKHLENSDYYLLAAGCIFTFIWQLAK